MSDRAQFRFAPGARVQFAQIDPALPWSASSGGLGNLAPDRRPPGELADAGQFVSFAEGAAVARPGGNGDARAAGVFPITQV